VFEQHKKEPAGRKLEQNVLRNDVFIISGTQGLKKFYVRAQVKDLEVRGMTILWDPATEGIMDPVVVVMSSAFAPFPGTGIAAQLGPRPLNPTKVKVPFVAETSLVKEVQFGGESVGLHCTRNFWVDDPFQLRLALLDVRVSLSDEVKPAPTGPNGAGANPCATRKNWFGFGNAMQ